MPNVVCYAMVLDRLTAAMKKDVRILEICDRLWGDLMYKFRRKRLLSGVFPVIFFFIVWNLCREPSDSRILNFFESTEDLGFIHH